MNLKLLSSFCLLAVVGASAEPAPQNLLGDLVTAKLIGGLLSAKKPVAKPILPLLLPPPPTVPNFLLYNALGQLIKGLTHTTGDAPKQLAKCTKLPIPGTVNDIVFVVISVGLVIKGVLNVLLAGAGTVFASFLLGLVKIIVCSAGKGKALFSTPPAVCGANYGVQWHLKTYNGGYDNIKKIIEFYEIQKIEHTIKETIQKVTKGLGIVALVGSARYIVTWVLQLIKIFKIAGNVKKTWTTAETVLVISKIVTIIGGIANSYKRGLGEDVAKGIITYICLSPHSAVFGGKELQQRLDNIVKHINKCDKHSLNGALNDTNTITKYNLTAPTKLSAPTNGATTTNITAPTKLSAPTNGATTTNITAPTKLSAPTNGATTTNITAPTKLSAPTNEATTTYITGPTKLSAPTNVAATTNVTAPTNEATTTRVTAPTNDTASTNSNDYYDDDIYYYSGDYYYDDYGAIINGTDPITGADSSSNQSDDISASTQN